MPEGFRPSVARLPSKPCSAVDLRCATYVAVTTSWSTPALRAEWSLSRYTRTGRFQRAHCWASWTRPVSRSTNSLPCF